MTKTNASSSEENVATKYLSKDGSKHATDERVNTISHIAAACLALLGSMLLITQAISQGDLWKIVGFSLYGLSIVSLFVFSTLHHGLNGSQKVNNVLRTFDYDAVFFFSAGTVTPLVLVLYPTIFGLTVLAAVWVVAVVGITLRSVYQNLPKHITNTLYIVLGWMPITLLAAGEMLPLGAVLLLASGGAVYSIGFVIYTLEKPNLIPGFFGFHELWHILVVLAAFLHYLLMYFYVLSP